MEKDFKKFLKDNPTHTTWRFEDAWCFYTTDYFLWKIIEQKTQLNKKTLDWLEKTTPDEREELKKQARIFYLEEELKKLKLRN